MNIRISGSVGKNGANVRSDTLLVQAILNALDEDQGRPYPPLAVDGQAGQKTVAAITAFQTLHGMTADGRIDASGRTLARLCALTEMGDAASLAQRVLTCGDTIILATVHATTSPDEATALKNIEAVGSGLEAQLSDCSTSPGGSVELGPPILRLMLVLAQLFKYSVSEIAGGCHSANSRHYIGKAIDINVINNIHVDSHNPHVSALKGFCSAMGCTEVLGPGDPGHATHVHAALTR